MKSLKRGTPISARVENITPHGIWMFVKGREYFLHYRAYPFFKGRTPKAIKYVQLFHERHLYWPALDVDLEIDNLENPLKYPLMSKVKSSRLGSAKR